MTARVALIGAQGHGLWHRREIARRQEAGLLRLVGLCDVAGVTGAEEAPIPPGVGIFAEHGAMLRETRPDAVVVCTPPHTHLPIAVDVLCAGADLLLEKPPVLTVAEHRTLLRVLTETGRACQVGFQALGSAALEELRSAIAAGRLGRVTGISAAAAWQRDDAYWRRSRWAGRRMLDGRPVLDGVLANACAHAVMQALATATAVSGDDPPVAIEVERYRCRDIEVDDTACMRLTLQSGLSIVVALTLCAEEFVPGEIQVHGTDGRSVLEYPTDRLDGRPVPGRVSLLDNLLAHRADRAGVRLIAPLASTAMFTAVQEAVQAGPPPDRVDERHLTVSGETVTLRGVNAAVRAAAEDGVLFSELDVPWATKPSRAAPERPDD